MSKKLCTAIAHWIVGTFAVSANIGFAQAMKLKPEIGSKYEQDGIDFRDYYNIWSEGKSSGSVVKDYSDFVEGEKWSWKRGHDVKEVEFCFIWSKVHQKLMLIYRFNDGEWKDNYLSYDKRFLGGLYTVNKPIAITLNPEDAAELLWNGLLKGEALNVIKSEKYKKIINKIFQKKKKAEVEAEIEMNMLMLNSECKNINPEDIDYQIETFDLSDPKDDLDRSSEERHKNIDYQIETFDLSDPKDLDRLLKKRHMRDILNREGWNLP